MIKGVGGRNCSAELVEGVLTMKMKRSNVGTQYRVSSMRRLLRLSRNIF